MHVVIIVHKNSQLKQKPCQNDERLWRYGSSKIVINLIQREIISEIEDFWLLSRSFNKRFLFLKSVVVFCFPKFLTLVKRKKCHVLMNRMLLRMKKLFSH